MCISVQLVYIHLSDCFCMCVLISYCQNVLTAPETLQTVFNKFDLKKGYVVPPAPLCQLTCPKISLPLNKDDNILLRVSLQSLKIKGEVKKSLKWHSPRDLIDLWMTHIKDEVRGYLSEDTCLRQSTVQFLIYLAEIIYWTHSAHGSSLYSDLKQCEKLSLSHTKASDSSVA